MRKFIWPCCSYTVVGVLGLLWAVLMLLKSLNNRQMFVQCPACKGTRLADYAAVPCEACGGSGVVTYRRGCLARIFGGIYD